MLQALLQHFQVQKLVQLLLVCKKSPPKVMTYKTFTTLLSLFLRIDYAQLGDSHPGSHMLLYNEMGAGIAITTKVPPSLILLVMMAVIWNLIWCC